MLTFHCRCGATIEINPPSEYGGYVVWDSDVDRSIEDRRETIRSFLRAVNKGGRQAWLEEFYGAGLSRSGHGEKEDSEVIEDILSRHDRYTRHLIRCSLCGRVYIQQTPGRDAWDCYREEIPLP